LVVASLGCPNSGSSKATAHLQGTVTIGGQPIPPNAEASITVRPKEIQQANASYSVITNGRFDIPAAPVGNVQVMFYIRQPTGKTVRTDNRSQPQPEYNTLYPPEKIVEIQVDGDQSDLNFNLETK
jgi:hypothetical protein